MTLNRSPVRCMVSAITRCTTGFAARGNGISTVRVRLIARWVPSLWSDRTYQPSAPVRSVTQRGGSWA